MGETARVDSAEIVLVRHGQTEWSRDGRHTGSTDVPLTEEGRRQAQAVGGWLERREFTRVVTSPLSRAAETCRLAGLGDRAEPRQELVEWDYGDYEGITTPAILERDPGWDLWRDGCPGGESPAEVAARVDRVLAVLRDADGDVAVFAHGHLLRVLAARWIGLGPDGGALIALDTATVSLLGHERERPVIRRWNAAGPV
jgi:probable phosphoglycerate mutase